MEEAQKTLNTDFRQGDIILLMLFSPKEYTFFLTILLILNFAGSGGDYLQVFEMRKYSNDIFFQDSSNETTVYKKK